MTTTPILYARAAEPVRVGGQPIRWNNPTNAVGAPNGTLAVDFDASRGGAQRLRLSAHDVQSSILAATGGVVPFSIDRLQVQVAFAIEDSATNYPDVRVLLGNGAGEPFATGPLYVADAGAGTGVVTAAVDFPDRAGYGGGPLAWRDLDDLYVLVHVGRSGAAGPDTFGVDAVGVAVVYTAAPPQGLASLVPASTETAVVKVYDRASNLLGDLPWSSLSRTVVRSALGSLTAQVPRSLAGGELIADGERWLRVVEDGVESPDWYILDDDGDDDADEAGEVRPISLGATSAAAMLDWGEVYSWEYDAATGQVIGLDPTYGFADATPGHILKTFIELAQARGCFPQLTISFTAEADSAGRAWPDSYARIYDIGTTVLAVLTGMSDDVWVEWEMVGFRLDVYVPDTTLAEDYPELVLYLGQSVRSGPRKRTRKGVRTVLLANGAEGATVEVKDPDALAKWGRREGYEGRGGVTDVGTLAATTEVSLQRMTTASESITLELTTSAVPDLFLPRPGGYIRYDQRRLSPTLLEPMRLQSIAWEYGEDPKVSVELNDLWVDRDIKLGRRVDALLNGSSANERVPLQPAGDDGIAPGAVQGLALVSEAYVGPDGQLAAQVTASWLELTVDADGTRIDDLLGYDIQWRQPEVGYGPFTLRTGVVTVFQWSPVIPDTLLQARIRAVDRYNNPGVWSDWETIRAGRDEDAPAAPTTPLVDNVLGLLRVRWDGQLVGGDAMPADFSKVEVHTSTLAGFDPNENPELTRAGILSSSGYLYLDTPYGQLQQVALVAVDNSGNRSAPSAPATGTSSPLLSDDIFEGAVGELQLADLVVTTAKVKELDLNNARVGTMSVAKLTAGMLNADVIVGNRIATGNRGLGVPVVELSSAGIFRWNAADEQTVAIDANGALLTGQYRTAMSGRRIEMGAAGRVGRIDFFSGGTYNAFVLAWTQASNDGVEAIQFGMQVPGYTGTLWNRINYNISPKGEYATYRSGVHEFMFDGSSVDPAGRFIIFQGVNRDTGPNIARFQINATNEVHWIPEGATGQYQWRWNGTGQAFANLMPGNLNDSARLALWNGQGYGAIIKFYTAGGQDAQRVEIRFGGDDGFYPVYASGFTVQSDATTKHDIVDVAPAALLADVRSAKVKAYRRRLPTSERPPLRRQIARGPVEIGLLAQDAPDSVVASSPASDGTMGVDLYQMAAATWGAVGELADLFDELASKVAAMTKGPMDA